MVFGLLFSRKQPKAQPADTQLRTPSPSIQLDESLLQPVDLSPSPELVTDASDLYQLIRSVPPQTLWTYTLTRLRVSNGTSTPIASTSSVISEQPVSPHTLTALTTFYASLTPPPALHCVRCHKSYTDVENNDRSCRVHHDDDSAEVDGYETLYNCCGKTVEGRGDMGPPDGWCYEGMHTTDTKRARFRADSTPYDDKLTSCIALHCHEPLTTSPRSTCSAKSRKARTSSPSKASNALSSPRSNATTRSGKRRRTVEEDDLADTLPVTVDVKGKGKENEVVPSDETEDSTRGRSRVRKRPRKSHSSPTRNGETANASSRQAMPIAPQDTDVSANEASTDTGPASRTRSRSRSRDPTKPRSSLAIIAAAHKAKSSSATLNTSSTSTPSKPKRSTKPISKSAGKPASKTASTKPASKAAIHRRGSSLFTSPGVPPPDEGSASSPRAQTPTSVSSTLTPCSPYEATSTRKSAPSNSTSSLHRRSSSSISMVVEIPIARSPSRSPTRPQMVSAGVMKSQSWRGRECVGTAGTAKHSLLGGKHLSEVVASSVDGEEALILSTF